MEIKKLKAFVVVAEELNFRRSAEILGMSQPPLTRLISSLEEDLMAQLFERNTRKVKLTSAGIFLLKEAREILDKIESMQNEIRLIEKIRSGQIEIAFSATSFLARLPQIIDEFQLRFPKVQIKLHQDSRKRILKKIKNGQIDVGLIEGMAGEGLESFSVKSEGMGVLIAKEHPLAKKKKILIEDLKNETIILHPKEEHPEFHDTIFRVFSQKGVRPKTYIKSQEESCPFLVSMKKGILLTITGARKFAPDNTKFIPIENLSLPVSVAWMSVNRNILLKSFLSFVSENSSLGEHKAECLMDAIDMSSIKIKR